MILIKARNIKSMNEEIEGYKYNLHTQVLLLVTIRVCNCASSGDAFFVFLPFYWWVVKTMGALSLVRLELGGSRLEVFHIHPGLFVGRWYHLAPKGAQNVMNKT